jgi:hypothetical protein
MRIKVTPGLVLGIIAVVIAITGTALAATGQLVNIADGSNAARLAKVDSTGSLQVGGSVVAKPASARYFTHFVHNGGGNGTCSAVANAPADRALVIQDLTLDSYSMPSPQSNHATFYVGTSGCTTYVYDITPGGIGMDHNAFDPGLVVPAGQSLFTLESPSYYANVYGTGYTIPAADAPATVSATNSSARSSATARK